MTATITSRLIEARETRDPAPEQLALLRLLHEVTVAVNQASTVQNAAQVCLDRICSQTSWPFGRVYIRTRGSGELTMSAAVWPGGDSFRMTLSRQDSASSGKAELPSRVLASRKAEFLISGPRQNADHRPDSAAEQAGLRAAAAFPILVENEVVGVLEKRVHELRDGKADRAALATLFTEVALRLSDQFKIPGSDE